MTAIGSRHLGGFTLVEVMIAVVLAGMIALVAHRIFIAAVDGSHTLRLARRSLDRTVGAHRLLTVIFLSVDVGGDGAAPFDGGPAEMRFSAWLETADGWFERVPVALSTDGARLRAKVAGGSDVVLSDSVASAQFDYLLQLGAESRWVSTWISPVSAPVAVRMRVLRRRQLGRVAGDTTLFLIGERG